MSAITWTNTFTTGQSGSLGTKLQQNFDDALTVLNGNIDGANISTSAQMNIDALNVATSADISTLSSRSLVNDLALTFGAGTPKKLMITDSSDVSLFEVDVSGNITIPLGMTNLYPIGTVTFFTGAFTNNVTQPGWYQCDGNNGTPDLTDLFIRGGSTSGQTGGYVDLTLGTHNHAGVVGAASPSHTHVISGTTASSTLGVHNHTLQFYAYTGGGGNPGTSFNEAGPTASNTTTATNNSSHTHTLSLTIAANADSHTHAFMIDIAGTGEDGVGDNIPAFYTLIPIMRVI